MATVSKWTPFGVAMNITATGGTVTRTSATKYTVKINASWKTSYSGNKTNYGMTASSGGSSATINKFGTKAASGSGSFTGTYSISGNGAATKTVTVTFKNFNSDNGNSKTKTVSFNVSVPAWTSYKISYNANGGNNAPSSQTKWKDQKLILSSTKPTRTGHSFLGWSTSASATSATYPAGGSYTANAAATLYAVWKANTYTINFNANGGSGAPGNQTKTYGKTLTLSSTKPIRTNYDFLGWSTSSNATSATYTAGGSYTANAAATLYAVWKLAYTKPRITKLTLTRLDDNYNISDTGTIVRAMFNWACDKPVSSITSEYKLSSASSWSDPIKASTGGGTSGSGQMIDIKGLNPEKTYNIRITVTDSVDSSTDVKTVQSTKFLIDFKKNGTGIGFGKAAEIENTADFGFKAKFTGGIEQPVLPDGTDMNSILTPNVYTGMNISTYEYLNAPFTEGSFTLRVEAAGPSGQIKQTITICNKSSARVWERFYYTSAWGDWKCVYDMPGTVLWSGGYYMTSGHTINLSENVTAQPSGICLVFSEYLDKEVKNQTFVSFFVSKKVVSSHGGCGHCFQMCTSNLACFTTKYLYISNDKIVGHDNNGKTMTGTSGITCTNNRFVLRYVIGV